MSFVPFEPDRLTEHRAFVRRLALALVRDPADAADLEQDTWAAYVARPPRSPQAAFAWLKSCVRQLAAKAHRGRERRARRELAAAVPESVESPAETLARLELHKQLVDELLALDEPYRTVLVLRYLEELEPRAIAARLGIPLNTVRARLVRGLVRLRERFLLAPGPGRGDTPRASALLALASGGIGMKSKFAAAAAAVALFTGGAWLLGSRELPVTPAGVRAAVDEPLLAAGAPGELPGEESVVAEPQRSLLPALAGQSPASGAEIRDEAAPPGSIAFEVYDPRAPERALEASARLLSGTRFGECSGSGRIEAYLSAGRYQIGIRARGYEPLELESIEVESGALTDLGRMALERGRGAIRGRVVAPYAAGVFRPVVVALRGDHRAPCERCDDGGAGWDRDAPCEHCGYAAEADSFELGAGDTFAFENLARGTYRLHAYQDEIDPHGVAVEVVLAPGNAEWIDLVLQPVAAFECELYDEAGRPFTGTWLEDGAERTEPVVLKAQRLQDAGEPAIDAAVSILGFRTALARVATLQLDRGGVAFEIPQTLGEAEIVAPVAALAVDERQAEEGWIPVDRPRQDGDALLPCEPPPALPAHSHLGQRREPGNVFRFEGLPREPLRVSVRCGRYESESFDLDLGTDPSARLPVAMHLNRRLSERRVFMEGVPLLGRVLGRENVLELSIGDVDGTAAGLEVATPPPEQGTGGG